MLQRIALVCIVLLCGACGGKPPPAETAPPPPQAAAVPVSATLADRIAAADVQQGKILFWGKCLVCHSLVPESEPGKIGPTLYGVIGRAAGAAPGYAYSDAVAKSGITWTANLIDKWLQQPSEFLPGNKMVFAGIEDPQDRANIIAYIEQESAKSLP